MTKIIEAIKGQAEAFITYSPGRKGDAKIIESLHLTEMDYEDLLELPKYRFLIHTHKEDSRLTHIGSIKRHRSMNSPVRLCVIMQ